MNLGLKSINTLCSDSQPGVIVYKWDLLKATACVCTRNINRMLERLENKGAKVLYIYPVQERDTHGRKLWRFLRARVKVVGVDGYTFYFTSRDESLFKVLSESWTGDTLKSKVQLMKATVRKAIKEVALEKGHVSVLDIVSRTHRIVDGLEIEKWLYAFVNEGEIKIQRFSDWFASRIILL